MKSDVLCVIVLSGCILFGFAMGFDMGKNKGYEQAIKDTKAAAPLPVPKTTDQQCVAWLFGTNLKEARKRVCK